jgi:hypothetical protein
MPKCALCETRKPRRHCPAVNGDICPQCCGASREVKFVCPLECDYLREARIHEKLVDVDPHTFPHQDIKITERFLVEQEPLLMAAAAALAEGALETNNAYDSDVREAIDAMIRTYRTLLSGLYYEALPDNNVAASIFRRARGRIEEFRERVAKETSHGSTRDTEVLGVLVFLQRMALDNDNERAKSRRFIDILRVHFPRQAPSDSGPRLIV